MISLNIQIVCNRPGFLICIKPQGIVSEAPGVPALLCSQENIPSLTPAHRLDQGTGGLLVLAKNPRFSRILSESFASQQTEKQYLAVVQAESIPESGEFEDLLYHDPKGNKSYVVRSMRSGVRRTSCSWSLLDTAETETVPLRLVRIDLHTGRTHQIRIQFASRGMPLFGDRRYGSSFRNNCPALWACGLSLPDPEHPGKILHFRSAPPDADPWNRFSPAAREEACHALP